MSDQSHRVGISTITFRHRSLEEALRLIHGIGAIETELGAIPDVVDHVPVPFCKDVTDYVTLLESNGLRSGAVNADVGDINDPGYDQEALRQRTVPLIKLAKATGGVLIVNCGRQDWADYVDEATDLANIAKNLTFLSGLCTEHGVRLLVEVLHHKRWGHTVARANKLLSMCGPEVFGLLLDVAHVGASEEDPLAWIAQCYQRIERVHLRDAIPGDLNIGIGRGQVDFGAIITALETAGFTGSYILELETHDVAEADRQADAQRSYQLIVELLAATGR